MKSILLLFTIIFFTNCITAGKKQSTTVLTTNKVVVEKSKPITIIFSGDLMQHISQINAAKKLDGSYCYDSVFVNMAPFWGSADFAVVNLETTIGTDNKYSGYPYFAAPKELVGALKRSGIDVIAFANNHTCDKGAKGIRKTLEIIRKENLNQVGINDSIHFFNKHSKRIALLNYTYGLNGHPIPEGFSVNLLDTVVMKKHIEIAKKQKASHILAFVHWGDEYKIKQNANQEAIAKWLKKQSVDVIIGSHPHVVQPIDTSLNVVYSLGNLVSNQRKRYTDGGISIKITIDDTIRIEYLPHWVSLTDKYKILTPKDTLHNKNEAFLKSLKDSRKIIGGTIKEITL